MNWINNVVRPKIRSILRKKEMPDNLWVKCPETGQMIYYKDLEANQFVVPGSNYHMRVAAPARLKSLFDGGEFETIARLFRPLAAGEPGARALMDDAAVLPVRAGHDLVVTKDALVSGVHFLPDDPFDLIARKALRVNLSDLAAKGAALSEAEIRGKMDELMQLAIAQIKAGI